MMNYYEINKKAMDDREIKCILEDDNCNSISSVSSISGEKISIVKIGDSSYYLSGKYDPCNSAKKRAKTIYKEQTKLQLFIGFGDGRVIREYCKLAQDTRIILIYEPCKWLFSEVIKEYDITDIILNENVYILASSDVDEINELYDVLQSIMTVENMVNLNCFVLDNYEKFDAEKVKNAIKTIHQATSTEITNWATHATTGKIRTKNMLSNILFFKDGYNASAFKNIFQQNITAIVVAAGPSLDKNIKELRKAKGKCFIIACDTALKPLLANGIEPDIFVVVDAEKPIELFNNEKVWSIPILTDSEIPDVILNNHIGKKMLYKSSTFVDYYLESIFGKNMPQSKDLPIFATGGSVANTAFSFAVYAGAKNIILVGQDLANTGGKIHASGTFDVEEKLTQRDVEYLVDSIDGGKVGTRYDFKHYLEWFERRIKKLQGEVNVIDATEGGALIHGSTVMKLKDAIDQYCICDVDVDGIISQISTIFDDQQKKKIEKMIADIPYELNRLKITAEKSKGLYAKIIKEVKKGEYSKQNIEKTLHKLNGANKKIDKNYLWPLISETNVFTHYQILLSTAKEYDGTTEELLIHDAEMGCNYLSNIIDAIDELMPLVEELACSF